MSSEENIGKTGRRRSAVLVTLLLLGLVCIGLHVACWRLLDPYVFWNQQSRDELLEVDRRLEKFERAYGVERLRRQALDPDALFEVPAALRNARHEYQRLIAEARIATAKRQRLLDGLRYAAVVFLALAVSQAIYLRWAGRDGRTEQDSTRL